MRKTESMTVFDVVLVPFPFTDLSSSKQRPCLVLAPIKVSRLGDLFVVAMMTSQVVSRAFPNDVALKDWKGAGLPKPTLVRLSKVVTVEAKLIRKRLGVLAADDKSATRAEFQRLFRKLLT